LHVEIAEAQSHESLGDLENAVRVRETIRSPSTIRIIESASTISIASYLQRRTERGAANGEDYTANSESCAIQDVNNISGRAGYILHVRARADASDALAESFRQRNFQTPKGQAARAGYLSNCIQR